MEFLRTTADTNITETERWATIIGGGSLLAYGLYRKGLPGALLAMVGGGLLYTGVRGNCQIYEKLGLRSRRARGKGTGLGTVIPYELGIRVNQSIVVNKPANELFRFWRNLENLPRFMRHVIAVTELDERRSHWVAEGPFGMTVNWDAEIIQEEPDKFISWRSLPGSDIDCAGSVHFRPHNSATEVTVTLQYNPPAGALGAAVAKLLGDDPARQIEEDLIRFKELMEKGVISSRRALKAKGQTTTPSQSAWDRDRVTHSSEESFPASDPPSWTPEHI
jgi:uncharacterized membrane protein